MKKFGTRVEKQKSDLNFRARSLDNNTEVRRRRKTESNRSKTQFSITNWKTLKSGCLSLLTIHRFWHSRQVRAVVRVWLGSGLGVSVSAFDSLSDAV
eukprot:sb/3479030/